MGRTKEPAGAVADQHAECVARRLVAGPRHRRAAEDRGLGNVDLRGEEPRDRARNMYLKGTRQTERGAKADEGLCHSDAAARLAHRPETREHAAQLRRRGPSDGRADDGRRSRTGRSAVVSMAQPKMGLVRWMLGRTFYPTTRTPGIAWNPIRPYDMATDTFAEFMGVRCDPLAETITQGLTKMTGPAWPAGIVAAKAPNGYVISTRSNDAFRAVSLLLEKGATVRRVPSGDGFTPGDFIVTAAPGAVNEVAKVTGVDLAALTSAVPPAPTRCASRGLRCISDTAAATWTKAGRD